MSEIQKNDKLLVNDIDSIVFVWQYNIYGKRREVLHWCL